MDKTNMQLIALKLESMDIPFKVAFRHSSASRDKTETAWVTASSNMATGYGESCPRSYVTGEDMSSVKTFFEQYRDMLIESIHDLDSLKKWITSHEVMIDQSPAAWCAIELALLDLLAKENQCTVEQLLGLPALQGEFTYTAVLGDSTIETYIQQVQQYASLGLKDYKIKTTDDLALNKEKITAIQTYIPDARIRLDANNLWDDAAQAIEHLTPISNSIFAVEEPIQVHDWNGLGDMAKTLDIKIILDESFTNKLDLQKLLDYPQYWIVNLRVSKLGGLLRSLEYAKIAKEEGIACIVGAQVGETSLLTRAGLIVAQNCKDNLIAQEGAFGLYLLENDICNESLMFGKQGKLVVNDYKSLNQPGFGLSVTDL